jgi:hypothetical protein
MNKAIAKALLSLISTLLCLGLLEGVTRMMIRRDPDGDLLFRDLRLHPLHPPVEKARELLDTYTKNFAAARVIYDPDLGWRPTAASSNGNSEGFVSSRPHPDKVPQPDCLRIALFGGSYTRGGSEESWWKVLDKRLSEKGVKAEVFNFGVGGYAMDQALLRWRKDGAPYHPDLVIFGFSAGNLADNLNILRLLQNPDTGIPFTKPRFILDNGALKLINSPTVPPQMLVPRIADLQHWPLLQYDRFYNPGDYQPRWWQASRLLSLIVAKRNVLSERLREQNLGRMDSEAARLALKIVQQFKSDVEHSGARFLVIHLPTPADLSDYQASGAFSFADLYRAVQDTAPVIQTEQNLMQVIGKQDPYSFFKDDHYNEALHASIGATAADYIAARWGRAAPGTRP